jgi:hypothetical protein
MVSSQSTKCVFYSDMRDRKIQIFRHFLSLPALFGDIGKRASGILRPRMTVNNFRHLLNFTLALAKGKFDNKLSVD